MSQGFDIKTANLKSKKGFFKVGSLTFFIFLGLIAGFFLGVFAPQWVSVVKPFQSLFFRGVKCVVAPLLFSTIVTGIASSGSFKELGKTGLRAFVYFEVITTLALGLGLLVVNLLQPGVGLQVGEGVLKSDPLLVSPGTMLTLSGFVEHLIPVNFADAMVRGDVLQIVIFSILFAFGTLAIGDKAKPILNLCDSLAKVMFQFLSYIMYLAPLGVCASIAIAVGENGIGIVLPLLKLILTLYFALFLFIVGILLPVCKFYQVPVLPFIRAIKNPVLFAFATTSSESAYPMALEAMENFGVPKRIVSFVLPMGYSFNLDGSTLYLSLASVFSAQVAGMHLSLVQQLLIVLTLMVTSKGVAAVPRTSFIILSGTLTAFGIPLEGLALILGVDTFMDMGRAAVNLLGNCLASAVVARCEGIALGVSAPAAEEGSLSAVVTPISK
jgi:proton glutamate symport protein